MTGSDGIIEIDRELPGMDVRGIDIERTNALVVRQHEIT